ncbi:hypothetical protein COOONC_18765 [Cooperia oncophora]
MCIRSQRETQTHYNRDTSDNIQTLQTSAINRPYRGSTTTLF